MLKILYGYPVLLILPVLRNFCVSFAVWAMEIK